MRHPQRRRRDGLRGGALQLESGRGERGEHPERLHDADEQEGVGPDGVGAEPGEPGEQSEPERPVQRIGRLPPEGGEQPPAAEQERQEAQHPDRADLDEDAEVLRVEEAVAGDPPAENRVALEAGQGRFPRVQPRRRRGVEVHAPDLHGVGSFGREGVAQPILDARREQEEEHGRAGGGPGGETAAPRRQGQEHREGEKESQPRRAGQRQHQRRHGQERQDTGGAPPRQGGDVQRQRRGDGRDQDEIPAEGVRLSLRPLEGGRGPDAARHLPPGIDDDDRRRRQERHEDPPQPLRVRTWFSVMKKMKKYSTYLAT
jgi:hypothetical protein